MVVLVCQEKKMDTAVSCVASQCKAKIMYCFKIKMGTAKFKRIIDQFSFSGKRRKEAFTFDNDSPSRTSTWLVSSR